MSGNTPQAPRQEPKQKPESLPESDQEPGYVHEFDIGDSVIISRPGERYKFTTAPPPAAGPWIDAETPPEENEVVLVKIQHPGTTCFTTAFRCLDRWVQFEEWAGLYPTGPELETHVTHYAHIQPLEGA